MKKRDIILFKSFIYACIALIFLTIIAPFVEIPYIDKSLENFGRQHPLITGVGIVIFGIWLIFDNFRDGHSDKWIRRIDYMKGALMVGLGFFHVISLF